MKILRQMALSLLYLIILCQYVYPYFPLYLWKRGTKVCEHIFGWLRVIMPHFTVKDTRQMAPKVFRIIRKTMEKNINTPKS